MTTVRRPNTVAPALAPRLRADRAGAKPAARRKQMRLLAAIGASLAMWAFIIMGVAGLILKILS